MPDTIQPSQPPTADAPPTPNCVRVCQNRTCKKQGAAKVLEAFQTLPVPGVTVTASSCLGQCGNGPMVLVLPDLVWYCGVKPSEVAQIVEQHLWGGIKVAKMLYRRFHPQK